MHLKQAQQPPEQMRLAYLDSLPEPQELHIELYVEAGQTWIADGIGYAVQCDNKLVEFFVLPGRVTQAEIFFTAVVEHAQIKEVLCKSFDHHMLFAACSTPVTVKPLGLLFRRIDNPGFVPRPDVDIRQGSPADAESIFAFNDDFFQSPDEIRTYAANNGLYVLEKDQRVIGCGVSRRVISGRPDIDIGMLVAEHHRNNGYGTHIISFLKDHYLRRGLRPICGCSVDNIASQQTLRRAGFVSEHRIVNIIL